MAELETVVAEAARDLVAREGRPLPPTVVLPLPSATRVVALPAFPDDDEDRTALLTRFAADEMQPANAPCYGFLAEATADTGGGATDVVVLVAGARGHTARVTAAPLADDGIGTFLPSEEVDPAAFPFLAPLQRAAEHATPPDVTGGAVGGTPG